MRILFASAALAAVATVGSAQTMKAEIPYAFSAGGKTMAAGSYELFAGSDEAYFIIRNLQSHDVVVVPRGSQEDPRKEWKSSKAGVLQLVCSDGCALQDVWTNKGYPAHSFGQGKVRSGNSHLAVIRLAVERAK